MGRGLDGHIVIHSFFLSQPLAGCVQKPQPLRNIVPLLLQLRLTRRKEIVEAAENRIANFIFTAEDTDTEPFIDICMEMQGYITNKDVASTVISDRPTAITNAIYDARAHADRFNILLIIGKGNERWIKDHHKHVPFDGDDHVVERMFGL